MTIRSFALEVYILYSGKVIKLYICLFISASKMCGEVKFVMKHDSQYFLFFIVSNSNTVRCEICLKFILNAK